MVITEIAVKRAPMPEFGFLKIALERVRRLVIEEIAVSFIRRRRGRLKNNVCWPSYRGRNSEGNHHRKISKYLHRLKRPDTDISDEAGKSDVSKGNYFSKEYFH